MSTFVEQHVVRLDVSMYDSLLVTIPQRTAQLGDPESHGVLGEGLAGDVESKVAAIHEIHNDVTVREVSHLASPVGSATGETGEEGRTGIRCLESCTAGCTETGGSDVPASVAPE